MLNRLLRGMADRLVQPIARLLLKAGVSPNVLTVAGFLIMATAAAVIAADRLVLGGWILLAGGLFDLLDGAAAKVGAVSSRRGAFLDSTLDRVADALLFGGILWQYLTPGGVWAVTTGTGPMQELRLLSSESMAGASMAFAALVLGFLVSYIKARAEGLGMECKVGIAERAERLVIPAAGLIFDQLVPALGLLVILSAITAVQRFVHVWNKAAGPAGSS